MIYIYIFNQKKVFWFYHSFQFNIFTKSRTSKNIYNKSEIKIYLFVFLQMAFATFCRSLTWENIFSIYLFILEK